jgi:hypothetical protein
VFARREFAGPFLNWWVAQQIGAALTNLWVGLIVMGVAIFSWHTPRLYELALSSSSWHEFEHACFFVASLIFWWPVVQPWPSRARAPRWAVVPYLLIGDLQNTIVSAILVFSDRVLYPSYERMPRLPRLFGLSAMQDQAASGAIMWVMGSLVFLVPAVVIAVQSLSNSRQTPAVRAVARTERSSQSLRVLQWRTPQWLKRRIGIRQVEAITVVVLFAAAGLSLAVLAAKSSDDDDQALRMRKTSGAFDISVFAARELLNGSNNIAVLVQDAGTHDALLDTTVELRAQQQNGPERTGPVRASAEDSENKLLKSADLELKGAGAWLVSVIVRNGSRTTEITLPLDVADSEHGSPVPWSFVWPLVLAGALIFAYLRRHRRKPLIASEIRTPETSADLQLTGKER